MFQYKIGYGTSESSDSLIVFHEKELNREGLAALVHKATINTLKKQLENNKLEHTVHEGPNFEDLLRDIRPELKELGFEFEGHVLGATKADWYCWGWTGVLGEASKGWSGISDEVYENTKVLLEAIPQDVKQRISELVNETEKEMHARLEESRKKDEERYDAFRKEHEPKLQEAFSGLPVHEVYLNAKEHLPWIRDEPNINLEHTLQAIKVIKEKSLLQQGEKALEKCPSLEYAIFSLGVNPGKKELYFAVRRDEEDPQKYVGIISYSQDKDFGFVEPGLTFLIEKTRSPENN